MKRFSVLAALMLLLVFSVGVFAQDDLTIAGAIEEGEDFSSLLAALEAADLLETLADEEAEFTLFAPSNDAFEALLEELNIDEEALLADPEALSEILLYHVVEGTLLSEDFEDDSELATLNGASLAITVNADGEIILDEFATVVEADIEVGNGVIHIIDAVLLPPVETTSGGGEACFVSTESEGTVQVRVGPGLNRTSIAFLPANVEFEVLGQATDDDGNIWFKLDKEEATPGRSNAEAWVSADAVDQSGDCDNVVDVNAPPLIPIVNQVPPTAAPSGDGGGGDAGGDATPAPATGEQIIVEEGTWTRNYAANFDASCQGSGNVTIPTTNLFSRLTDRLSLTRSGTGFLLGGETFTFIGDNTYQASEDLGGGLFGTIYVHATAANHMDGRLIFSFSSGAAANDCSATLYFTLTR